MRAAPLVGAAHVHTSFIMLGKTHEVAEKLQRQWRDAIASTAQTIVLSHVLMTDDAMEKAEMIRKCVAETLHREG